MLSNQVLLFSSLEFPKPQCNKARNAAHIRSKNMWKYLPLCLEEEILWQRYRGEWAPALTAPTLPRLSWEGTTEYSHQRYSPSSEAG